MNRPTEARRTISYVIDVGETWSSFVFGNYRTLWSSVEHFYIFRWGRTTTLVEIRSMHRKKFNVPNGNSIFCLLQNCNLKWTRADLPRRVRDMLEGVATFAKAMVSWSLNHVQRSSNGWVVTWWYLTTAIAVSNACSTTRQLCLILQMLYCKIISR